MSTSAMTRSRDMPLVVAVFLLALGLASWLHWPALENYGVYKEDIQQSPHWAAYHSDSFRADDLILDYASFNESPLQNGIYWIGTLFVEYIRLTKILAVLSYGLLAVAALLIGRAMFGLRFGLLLFLFTIFLPPQWEYSAGFFSKVWSIPLLLVCLLLLQKGRSIGFIALLPFAALAYPSVAVLIGMTASVFCVQEWLRDRPRAWRLFRHLAIGSLLAVAILSVKYVFPQEAIGPMRSGAELREMPELLDGGYPSQYIPIPPLVDELFDSGVGHGFVLLSAIFYFLLLGRGGVRWERPWTALLLASLIGYLLADLLFMRLYVPNRFTRYSLAALLALWHAGNWDLILDRFRSRSVRTGMLLALIAGGLFAYSLTFEFDSGWSDKREMVPVCRFIREELPAGILVAGSPRRLDDVAIQAKRSILVPYKLAHPWFVDYYDEIRRRTRVTLRAHFAAEPAPINALHERYGATHFLVQKSLFSRARRNKRLFADPYGWEIYAQLGERRSFFLEDPPAALVVWEDESYALIPLPIPHRAP